MSTKQVLEEDATTDSGHADGWRVILFNCDCHSFDEVERVLIKATRCSLAKARAISTEVHTKGSAIVYNGPRERCEAVAEVIGSIGLAVKVAQ